MVLPNGTSAASSLLSGLEDDIEAVCSDASTQCHLDRNHIEDILPCSPFQCDVVASAATDGPETAIGQARFELPGDINVERLKSAWSDVVRLIPALRTRIITVPSGNHLQVIVHEGIHFQSVNSSVDEAASAEQTSAAVPGGQCNRYALVDKANTNKKTLVWTFSRALVDTTFQKQILRQVEAVYDGEQVQSSLGMEELLRHVRTLEGAQISSDGDVEGTSFPPLPTNLTNPCPRARATHQIPLPCSATQKRSVDAKCRAALAVLISRYTRSSDVAFDVVVERPPKMYGQRCRIDGPTRSTISCNVHVDPDDTVSDLIQDIQEQDAAMHEFEQASPRNRKPTAEYPDVTSQTLLAVTSFEDSGSHGLRIHRCTHELDNFSPYTDHALLLQCEVRESSMALTARYDPNVMDGAQTNRLLRQLGALIEQNCGDVANLSVQDFDPMSTEDRDEIRKWNSVPPPEGTECIPDVIGHWAKASPQHPAISAWDGNFSYADLDDASSRLAACIQEIGLGSGSVVPLCFEKSKWTVVSMLAVLKAGAAFSLVDPSLPSNRVDSICQQVSAKLALVHESQHQKMQSLVPRCITVDDTLIESLVSSAYTPASKPQDLAYVIFTSGSTGEPKGSMIEHRSITSYASVIGPAFKVDQETRGLQFASYAYAVCLAETFGVLMTGGCLCIPSEHDRVNDISSFIRSAGANFAIFTPSFIGAIHPDSVPSLKVLMMVGEPMTPETRDTWAGRVQLLNGCGQSECLLTSIGVVHEDDPDVRVIGRGSGTRLWITDPSNHNRLAPVGCPGELLIESHGRGRGYLDLPEASAAKFLTEPPAWYPEQAKSGSPPKFYRTGDLASYQSDGRILNLGREDSLVKIRGQRVELGDVEFHLRKISSQDLKPMVDLVQRPNSAYRQVLVAFLIGPLDAEYSGQKAEFGSFLVDRQTADHYTAQLAKQIARYAIPGCYISLEALPTTTTGKTDRKKLRAIASELLDKRDGALSSAQSGEGVTQKTEKETTLANFWAETMSIDVGSVGKQDSFFDLGGDSIMAIQMANKARASGMPLEVADVLHNPVLSELAAITDSKKSTGMSEEKAIPPQPRNSDDGELSFAQRGLWFLEQLNPGTPAYNVSIAGRLRGLLDLDALRAALQALEDRHETLRTTFKERNGSPAQIIHRCRPAEDMLRLIDMASHKAQDVSEELHRQQSTAFDLQSTPPWRVAVLRLSTEEHILSITMHHIISDGWSDDILRRDLATFYSAAIAGHELSKQLEPLPIQYRDFAAWQQDNEQMAEQDKQLQYWKEQLADSVPAELLVDKIRPALPSGVAGVVEITIDGTLHESLQHFCKSQQTTPFVVLLAAFRAAHFRMTGAEDATIGTPNASRNRSEVEDLVGFFSNTQCMRIKIEDETFQDLVQQVKATVAAALAHQDVPFERVVQEVLPGSRDASRNPLVQLMFAVHSQPSLGEIHLEGLTGEALRGTESTRFDLEFHLVQKKDHFQGNLMFAKDLFEPETIQAVADTFKEMLQQGLEQTQASLPTLSLPSGITQINSRRQSDLAHEQYPRDSSIIDMFSEQVAACPHTTAAKDSDTQLSYAELDRQSNVLATWLSSQKLPAESWVGVLASRSCETIVAFFGILKANLAYVPLDVDAPANRINGILSAFEGRKLILVGAGVQIPELPIDDVEFVGISGKLNQQGRRESHSTITKPSATSLAYVMFTSGSTGKPKGVMIEHRGVVRLVKQTNVLSGLPRSMKIAHLFNIAFDLSVWEIYTALLNGGTVVCVDQDTKTNPHALEQLFCQEDIEAAMLPPVLLKSCLAQAPNMLKNLKAYYNGADRFDSHDATMARKLVPGRIVNAYGPTENSALSTIYDVQKGDVLANGVPIGKAISNSGAYVMDANQRLVPIGVMGELVVTGDGVARGYTDPDLNTNRFVEVEIEKTRMRAYRTGDRVRIRATDGEIEFFGRMDSQVKIRGFRLELAEVEHAILTQDEVADAAVVINQRKEEEPDLIGFITSKDDAAAGQEETSDQVESWGQQFDNNFYQGIEDIDESTLGSDFTGWTSMYDGSKIDRSEMQEWLKESMKTMLDGQAAGRVFEIGTGTGMVLFNLGEGLENYVGIDPSKPAVTFASEKAKEIPGLASKVKTEVGTASDVNDIDSECSELVVLNSVVQYFPSPEYLRDVIDAVAGLPDVKRLFIGDVRSYALNRQFIASRALYKLGDKATKANVREEMAHFEEREEELLVSPAFFTGLKNRISRVQHVEILPHMMEATNELSSYRYGVVIHFKTSKGQETELKTVDVKDWVDFSARKMDQRALAQLLKESSSASTVAVSNVPYSKTVLERHIVDALDAESESEASDQASWLSGAREEAKQLSSMSAVDLVELGRQHGLRTEVSWSRQFSQSGGLDAIFHRYTPKEADRVKFLFPSDDAVDQSLSNRPLQGLRNIQTERRVRSVLQAHLPSYMIPSRITVLEQMPTNANGKVDRKQLTKLAESAPVRKSTAAQVPPQNDEERALCEEFSKLLGVDVSPEDDFFALGGHSLMAMRLLPRLSDRLGWHILLRDLYEKSTPRALYNAETSVPNDANGSQEPKWPSFMEFQPASAESRATLVLVHGFWGQGRIFAGLMPILDKHLDVIILHDPFFGRQEGPRSLDEWSDYYLDALHKRLPKDSRVIVGGYSFGSFTALKMASLWEDWFGVPLASVILFDPAVWEPVNVDELSKEFIDEKVNYGLRLFGEEQRAFVMEHFKKFGPLMASPKEKPVYEGRGLHIASSEVAKQGVPDWWASHYSNLEQECIEATHHGLFEWDTAVKEVGKVVNEHYGKII